MSDIPVIHLEFEGVGEGDPSPDAVKPARESHVSHYVELPTENTPAPADTTENRMSGIRRVREEPDWHGDSLSDADEDSEWSTWLSDVGMMKPADRHIALRPDTNAGDSALAQDPHREEQVIQDLEGTRDTTGSELGDWTSWLHGHGDHHSEPETISQTNESNEDTTSDSPHWDDFLR
ncbi:hypothetical protein Pan216_32440 [Planctomycetes bacterium Pan216]|uniref:Uncharacterized protein n=1 Tax=Kolteria novifilia TaxID=2527975 RepID=A0A518B5X1_9BACT|nr:hypothetical protein Pan216_32440 [Planctomycetes bacterium Pan216]